MGILWFMCTATTSTHLDLLPLFGLSGNAIEHKVCPFKHGHSLFVGHNKGQTRPPLTPRDNPNAQSLDVFANGGATLIPMLRREIHFENRNH